MTPRWIRTTTVALFVALLPALAHAAFLEDPAPETLLPGVKWSGVFDARVHRSGRGLTFLKDGSNPQRYGGVDSNADGGGDRYGTAFSIPQASVVADISAPLHSTVHVQVNYASDAPGAGERLGIVEGYAQTEAAFTHDALRVRAGGLIPPLSWENTDTAWTSPYTLTPSVFDSWVGEEVRVFGVEGVWERDLFLGAKARATAGLFSGGDHIGYLMWQRGWTFDDYQGQLNQKYSYEGQTIDPSQELDGNLGYYGRADAFFFNRALQVGAGYWTNNANSGQGLSVPPFDNFLTQPFRTTLYHVGAKAEEGPVTVIAHFARTTIASRNMASQDYDAAYLLGSVEMGRTRLSARYDRFWIPATGYSSDESGFGVTLFAGWNLTLRQQLAAECVVSNLRPAFEPSAPAPRQAEIDRTLQLNYRLKF
jgi:hypothetical protein